MGSLAANASFYWKDMKISAVFIPSFTPALLPSGNWSGLLTQEIEPAQGLTVRNVSDRILMPSNNLKASSTAGVRIEQTLFDYDFSLSYIYGRDDLPIPQRITFVPTATYGEVDIEMELMYPRLQIVGLDLAGEMIGAGIWAEMAIFLPEEVILTTDLSLLGMGAQQSIALENVPFAKYIIGTDYTFGNGIYLNFQYLHGFIHERGRADLGNYLMFGGEWTRADGKFILKPLQGGIEIQDIANMTDTYAVVLAPEIIYKPVDGAKLSLGYRMIEGSESATFGKMKEYDEIFLKAKYSF
jgi:hypothetical protein